MTEKAKKSKILCIIPARGASKRFPRKNIALLSGKPLIAYTIDAATQAGIFEKVVVSTEDPEIKKISEGCGAEVYDRPAHLASDTVRIPEVCLDTINAYEKQGQNFDLLFVLQPTCPLRKAVDIAAAYDKFVQHKADYLLSTTDCSPLLRALKKNKKGFLKPVLGKKYLGREQDNPKIEVPNGAIAIAKISKFKKNKDYYGRRLVSYEMPIERSVDIDEPAHLRLAEFFLSNE